MGGLTIRPALPGQPENMSIQARVLPLHYARVSDLYTKPFNCQIRIRDYQIVRVWADLRKTVFQCHFSLTRFRIFY